MAKRRPVWLIFGVLSIVTDVVRVELKRSPDMKPEAETPAAGCDTGVFITEDVHLDSDQHEAAEVSQQNMTKKKLVNPKE